MEKLRNEEKFRLSRSPKGWKKIQGKIYKFVYFAQQTLSQGGLCGVKILQKQRGKEQSKKKIERTFQIKLRKIPPKHLYRHEYLRNIKRNPLEGLRRRFTLPTPKDLILLLIELYQKGLSLIFPPSCRFYPSCSEYAKQSIIKYGVKKGFIKSIWRILRCNPFSKGGYDPT